MLDFGHQQWQVFDNSELLSLIIKVYIYIYIYIYREKKYVYVLSKLLIS
jgi:hypothetical protein